MKTVKMALSARGEEIFKEILEGDAGDCLVIDEKGKEILSRMADEAFSNYRSGEAYYSFDNVKDASVFEEIEARAFEGDYLIVYLENGKVAGYDGAYIENPFFNLLSLVNKGEGAVELGNEIVYKFAYAMRGIEDENANQYMGDNGCWHNIEEKAKISKNGDITYGISISGDLLKNFDFIPNAQKESITIDEIDESVDLNVVLNTDKKRGICSVKFIFGDNDYAINNEISLSELKNPDKIANDILKENGMNYNINHSCSPSMK